MRDCWLVHPDPEARRRWSEALPELQVRAELEPCPKARVLILGASALVAEARELAPSVPLVVISGAEPEPFYAAGVRSVIEEPQTPEQRQAVVQFWCHHNVV
jgi:hypothetical protein